MTATDTLNVLLNDFEIENENNDIFKNKDLVSKKKRKIPPKSKGGETEFNLIN